MLLQPPGPRKPIQMYISMERHYFGDVLKRKKKLRKVLQKGTKATKPTLLGKNGQNRLNPPLVKKAFLRAQKGWLGATFFKEIFFGNEKFPKVTSYQKT